MSTITHEQLKKTKPGGVIKVDHSEGDAVFHPPHYTQYKGMEPFTFFFLNNVPFDVASACKYILRHREKNGIEDLKKARRIIDMMIEMETNRGDYTPKKPCL